MSVFGIVLLLTFVAAQGAVVFGTAKFGLHLLATSKRSAKIAAMVASYFFWIALTVGSYAIFGGGGGLMEGFAFVLFLCLTALISSFVYLVAWTTRKAA